MKSVLLIFLLSVSQGAMATVIEMDDGPAESVIEVYEEMREEQQETSDNGWIHEFEKDSVGSEMDHLSGVKRAVVAQEEM
ncbi:MAG: hypothetical protein V4598_07735 [Bdellovibrionota bacterium]